MARKMFSKLRSDKTTPFWLKIFSSNWWWYGEVDPDPARLPPPDKRPRLWRADAIFFIALMPVMMFVFSLSAELNSRYWSFNQNRPYFGVILTTQNGDRQLLVQLTDTTRVEMGFPIADTLGIYPQVSKSRPRFWEPAMKKLIDGHYQCPGRRLKFYGEPWKLTFRPVIRIWRVDCADTHVTLVDQKMIEHRWHSYLNGNHIFLGGISLGFSLFGLILVVHREKKLSVKDVVCLSAKSART